MLSDGKVAQTLVRSTALLRDIAAAIDFNLCKYLFVENANGQLVGIVETSQINELLSAPNVFERERWQQMSVESALRWKIPARAETHAAEEHGGSIEPESASARLIATQTDEQYRVVKRGNDSLAVVSDDSLFVNWELVKRSLSEAMIDAVTSLPNRKSFERRLDEEIQRARRQGHSVAVVLFDVDYFKRVNDVFGHGVGDNVLAAIANNLLDLLRSYDVLVRYGGDEFAAICCACAPNEVDIPLQRIQNNFKKNFAKFAVDLPPISLTIGAAVAHDLSLFANASELIEMADVALYSGKKAGRDCTWKIEISNLEDLKRDPVPIRGVKSNVGSSTTSSSIGVPGVTDGRGSFDAGVTA